ncbi:hypothetical protein CIL05_07030 [Virgibacillus profundi]|uniref:Large polyvalent protein associated domain-containing protein n=1 Tax=Virgibacillus profundi TaxID=2024555 RepID=A0A2A2IGK1_9BACI|nr:LPD29 domain-containing protein [Virgibacillus profundi]PAV30213.1 hypothetical protein CIL05_07030 [Virgibacillus profundi]PXY54385.1 hypothetical protein CIT14_07115 [Virgibacillus profundi]
MLNVELKINDELKGIELYFDSIPNPEVRNTLKSSKFRFSSRKKCWYAKQNEDTFKIANALTNSNITTTDTQNAAIKKTTNKNTLSLWEATQWIDIEVNNNQETKQMAKEIRQHLKKRFPQCKISVTSDYNHINVTIKQSPYNEDSQYLKAIRNYCNNLVNAYKHCYNAGDPYTDIPASYNFYFFNTSVNYDYNQTEVTEEVKKNMELFDQQQALYEQAEEARKEEEYQEYMKQQELRNIEYKKQQEETQKQVEHINNSINVKSLEDDKQYYIIGAEFANLNKNNTLDQYIEEVQKGDYSLENVKVTKELHFDNQEALTNYSNMLLNNFEFLQETGGSYTEDNRINSMTDFHNMDKMERNTVQWNLTGVAVFYNDKLQFVIDAQGHDYARYVGLTDNATIQIDFTFDQVLEGEELQELKLKADELESISTDTITELNIIDTWQTEHWTEYKDTIKDKLKQYQFKLTKGIIQQLEIESLKTNMYKLLIEVDGIQDQFMEANIKQGEKLTLFYISDWGSIVTSRITFDNCIPTKYAQYDNAIKLTFTPERKRKLHYNYFHSTLLVYKGWHELPEEVLHTVEHTGNMRITKSKYHSVDNRQYDEILSHYKRQDIIPIINTYKPVF